MDPVGLEPTLSKLWVSCFYQLSYGSLKHKFLTRTCVKTGNSFSCFGCFYPYSLIISQSHRSTKWECRPADIFDIRIQWGYLMEWMPLPPIKMIEVKNKTIPTRLQVGICFGIFPRWDLSLQIILNIQHPVQSGLYTQASYLMFLLLWIFFMLSHCYIVNVLENGFIDFLQLNIRLNTFQDKELLYQAIP